MTVYKKLLSSANTRENAIAQIKLATVNPGTSALVNITISPMMTNVNNPSVMMLIGKVRKIRIGRIVELMKPKTTATTSAVKGESIVTPGRM